MHDDHPRCCVDGCDSSKRRNPHMPFHLFPRWNPVTVNITNKMGVEVKMERKLAWEYLLLRGRPAGNNSRVCARHFAPSDYFPTRDGEMTEVKSGSHLKIIAVPSRNLPGQQYLRKDYFERFHADVRCRVCKTRTFEVRSVFESERFAGKHTGIDQAIVACASVKVEREDGLPQFVCVRCLDSLHEALKFRELCESTDAELRGALRGKDEEESLLVRQDPLEDGEGNAVILDDDREEMDVFDTEELKDDEQSDDNSSKSFHDMGSLSILYCKEHNYARPYNEMQDETELLSPEDIKEEIEELDIKLETSSVNSADETQGEQEEEIVDDELDSLDENQKVIDKDNLLQDEIEEEVNQNVVTNNEAESNFVKPRKKYNSRNRYKTENSYKCGLCGFVSQISHQFKKHQALHYKTADNKRLRCRICSKPFPDKGYLNHHLRIHFRINQCEFCQKHFPSHPKLLAHKRRHLGEEPYECSVCNQRFGVFQALADHKHVHTDQLTFECNVCAKRFKLRDTMLIHRRLHQNERLFRCSVCKRAFAFKDKFRMHLLMHHRLDNFRVPDKNE